MTSSHTMLQDFQILKSSSSRDAQTSTRDSPSSTVPPELLLIQLRDTTANTDGLWFKSQEIRSSPRTHQPSSRNAQMMRTTPSSLRMVRPSQLLTQSLDTTADLSQIALPKVMATISQTMLQDFQTSRSSSSSTAQISTKDSPSSTVPQEPSHTQLVATTANVDGLCERFHSSMYMCLTCRNI